MAAEPLVLVESHEKANAIRAHIDIDIVLTNGRIVDLPWNARPFDPEALQPVDKKTYRTVCEAVASASMVFVATDDDDEGEAIALHLVNIIEKAKRPWRRVRIVEFTPEGIARAFEQSLAQLDDERALQAIQMRFVDHAIAKKLSTTDKNIIVGRVEAPLLNAVADGQWPEKAYGIEYGGLHIAFDAPAQMHKLEPSRPCPIGLNVDDILSVAATEGVRLPSVMDELERLYLGGMTSYPRTQTRVLDNASAGALSGLMAKHGKPWRTALKGTNNSKGYAHPPIMPATWPLNETGVAARQIAKHYEAMSQAKEFVVWRDSGGDLALPAEAQAKTIEDPPVAWRLLKFMQKHSLGRPSNRAQHVRKVEVLVERAPSGGWRLNHFGVARLMEAWQKMPRLFDMDNHKKFVKELAHAGALKSLAAMATSAKEIARDAFNF